MREETYLVVSNAGQDCLFRMFLKGVDPPIFPGTCNETRIDREKLVVDDESRGQGNVKKKKKKVYQFEV